MRDDLKLAGLLLTLCMSTCLGSGDGSDEKGFVAPPDVLITKLKAE